MRSPRRPAVLLALTLTLTTLGTLTATAAPTTTDPDPVPALTRVAQPLRTTEPGGPTGDLRPLGRMIGDAKVVGIGEATHSSHEFFANKHRVLRHLVEEKGFTAFALEANWSSGLRIDDYVVHGKGDIRQIMREEFQDAYRLWNTREYLDLFEWMRAYNAQHSRKIHFVGNDAAYAGPEPFDRVTDYVRAHHPALLPRLTELYRAQRPVPGVSVADAMQGMLKRPLAERRAMAADARTALGLLAERRQDGDRREFELAVQHARAISQVAGMYGFDMADPKGVADTMRYRDEVMAANTAWWHERTGAKVVLSAHNAHVSYVSADPKDYPRMQGAFLRDRLGRGYVNVRLTFDRGSFNAMDDKGRTRVVTLDPARAGSNEHTLDRVPHRDYALDMRTAPAPARKWLEEARPTRDIGTSYPEPDRMTALASSYDILIHLHRVREAGLLAP